MTRTVRTLCLLPCAFSLALGCSSGSDSSPAAPAVTGHDDTSTSSLESGPLAAKLRAEMQAQYAKVEGLTFDQLKAGHSPAYLEGGPGFDVTQATFHDEFISAFNLSAEARDKLKSNGFVVVPGPARYAHALGASKGAGPADIYYRVFQSNLPVFVSADSILHAWHRTFDKLLETSETSHLAPALGRVIKQTLANLPADDAHADARFYMAVAASLLDPQAVVPADVAPQVNLYLGYIAQKQLLQVEFMGSLTWIDFSQFEPRGHYTHSELLKKYFRAMMWLGRTDLVLAGTDDPRPREETAARAIAGALGSSTAKTDFEAMDRFYAAFVGKTNALTPLALSALCEQAGLATCKGDASAMAPLYAQQTPPEYSSRVFAEAVPPIAMRFFPQRFAYCAWVTSQTTTRRLKPDLQGGRAMAMPEDVAFAFGSDRALEYYAEDMQKPYRENLPATLQAVRATMDAIPPSQLEPTIMNEWMEGLRAQSRPTVEPIFPSVMRTPMWHDHKLETVLASWSELRHDTILIVEQSTGGAGCQYPKGYVEPVPKLYQALSRAADRMQQLYAVVPSPDSKLDEFFAGWRDVLARLESMSNKELASQPMSDDDLAFLNTTVDMHLSSYAGVRMFNGWYPRLYWFPSWSNEQSMEYMPDDHPSGISEPLVADVHTDAENELALEVATGHPGMMVIAIDNGADRTVYGGPVASYYSFQVPVDQRMADDQWLTKVDSGDLPARPAFASKYWAQ